VDVYFNPNSTSFNQFGFLIVNSKDVVIGSFVHPLESCTKDGNILALSHCFESIITTYSSDPSRRTYQIVHKCPAIVRAISRRNNQAPTKPNRILAHAQSLLSDIPPEVWIVWDGGRRTKTDAHFRHLRKLLRPNPHPTP